MSENTNNTELQQITAPLSGDVRHLVEVPDLVFSRKLTGNGIAIKPATNNVISPFDGEVMQLFPTLHAIGIRSTAGIELLIHIGLDTVQLQGEGFEAFVKEGDKITAGQKLIEFDLDFIEKNATSTITPIIMMNGKKFKELELTKDLEVEAGNSVIFTTKLR